MTVDYIIGSLAGTIIFLIIAGYEFPVFLLVAVLLSAGYLLLRKQGMLGTAFFTEISSPGRTTTFGDIGGQHVAKKELIEAMDFIREADKTNHMGIRPLKGILLTGPPGTGKTMLAKAAANYTDAIFLATSGSEFVEMYAGVGAQRVREIFSKARKRAAHEKKNNAVLFIDEIEVLGVKRGSHANHMEYDQTLNQLLVEMDGIQPNGNCQLLVIAATNRDDMIDPALLRPGRFDRIVRVDLPDKDGRLKILQLHTANKPIADDVSLENIARDTFGFSGAHLESLANEAAILAFREGKKHLQQIHFKEAIDKVMLGEKMDRKPQEKELWRVAVHETGHAMISELERPGSVAHVTIVPRGQAMGYIRQSPQGDSYLQTKSQIESQIKIALAGVVAEEVVFQERSTGAVNDIQEAIKLSRRLVDCGLSDLGIVDGEPIPDVVSETMGRIINGLENEVKEILQRRRVLLKQIATRLRQDEHLSGDNLRVHTQYLQKAAQ